MKLDEFKRAEVLFNALLEIVEQSDKDFSREDLWEDCKKEILGV
jgi:hypothetical protein